MLVNKINPQIVGLTFIYLILEFKVAKPSFHVVSICFVISDMFDNFNISSTQKCPFQENSSAKSRENGNKQRWAHYIINNISYLCNTLFLAFKYRHN